MNQRLVLVLISIFSLIIGIMIGTSMLGGLSQPPDGHEEIAELISIRDNTFNQALKPVYVGSGETVELSIIQLSFTGSITFSKWEFRTDVDDPSTAMAFAMVWGPGTADEYFCEVGRLSTNAYTVTTPAGSTTWVQGGSEGFVYFMTS